MKPLLKPTVLLATGDDGYVAYDMAGERLLRLNPLAALMAELADGSRSCEDIVEIASPLTDDSGRTACAAWLGDSIRDGLLVDAESTPLPELPTAAALRRLSKELRSRDLVLAAFLCQQRVLELEPGDPSDCYRLGELAHIVGRRADARQAYAMYQRSHPEDAEIEHLLRALGDETPPTRASDACIERIYGYFAAYYDHNMCDELAFRAPELLAAALGAAVGDRRDLVVLDAGCGTGLFGLRLKPFARRLVGVDLSEAMLKRARARGIYDVLEKAELTAWFGDMTHGEHFDVIGICDTLIYFGNLRQVLPGAARRLKAGGILGFTVEKGEDAPHALTDSGRYTHHRDHLLEVVAEVGCEIVSQAEETLRFEYGDPVAGWVTVIRRR
ncbi:MAG: methyltransferase [Planctomycetaceae bacterium]